ncbi:helix-turn-helix domain-containing protein [Micromonospora musae]|uniref:helix-turn-helix domain-containing protein n=1 Tax=Micromonospora musae TaxID=1894970 RepID=UPI0033F2DD77
MRDTRPLATSAELAEHLGVPPRTLDQWAYKGVGPRFSKVGRHRRYRWADVETWLDQQSEPAGRAA